MHPSSMLCASSALFLLFRGSSALVAKRALRAPTFTVSTYAGEATGFPYVGRDGGGGGSLNGKNIIIYSDTTTTDAAGGFVNFSSNSYAFVPNPKQPLILQDFGSAEKPEVPMEIVPWYGIETCSKNFIWPNNPLVTQYNDPTATQAYAIYSVGLRTSNGDGSSLYNTLVSISADDSSLTMTRVVPQLYPIGGVQYGGFATTSHSDGNLYLFGSDSAGGLKLARVPWDSASQTSRYSYWNSSGWVSDSTSAETIVKTVDGAQFSSGDAFWSDFYGTWLIVSLTTFMNQIYIQYSEGGHIVGPYSAPVLLWNTAQATNLEGVSVGNYAGHAYPQWLGMDSNELIISWTYNTNETHMALVTFS